MQAHFSTRALLLLSSLIHLSIAAVIPSSDDFFSTEPFPSFDSAFNDGSSPSNRLALAPTTPYVETAPQEELTNFNTDLLAEEPTSTLDQGGQQGVTSGQFILPENNGLPTLEQSSPNQLQAPTKLNTGDTQPLPGPNTLVCKNANEPIPVCHNMHERTLLPPPLDIEMCTTISPTYPYCPGLDDLLWCCKNVKPMPRGGIPEYDAQKINHWYGGSCHPNSQKQ